MYSRILKRMSESVRLRHYIVTLHAVAKMSIIGKLVIIAVYGT